ncbi:Mannuronan C5-epimerase AlgE2 [Brevundimonas sp. NIBR10]|uniref:calcium-binding protein n=1 Tax=Brevundimonas sp. NIBR10 TaxID=3015997 RepID=UPI0022F163C3|nr:calcium-binding protein [Brevundimonas sp. NIBR10]WGM47211.1 Mannuronan C5-epimerase AlgE2 [Brevundimonas sp. NIBR10]
MPTIAASFLDSARVAAIFQNLRNGDPRFSGGEFIISDDNAGITFEGTFGSFVNGYPTSGTITSMWWVSSAGQSVQVRGLNVSVAALFSAANSNNLAAFTQIVFEDAGGFVITGASDFDDVLHGFGDNDTFNGLNGNDTFYGEGGNDTLNGGLNDDRLFGGAGNDILLGFPGNDLLDGGDGVDIVTFQNILLAYQGIGANVSLLIQGSQNTNFGMDTFVGVENVYGTVYADTLRGDNSANQLWGLGRGNDSLFGEGGNDVLIVSLENGVSAGSQTVEGGSGTDTLWFSSTGTVSGVVFNLEFQGLRQNVPNGSVLATGIENIDGSTGGDTLVGDANINQLRGGSGADTIDGRAGADRLTGDAGADVLIGGAGADQLFGGTDADIFRYLLTSDSTAVASDVINDFQVGDRIDLAPLSATSISVARLAGGISVIFAETPGGSFQTQAIGAVNGTDILHGGLFGVYMIGSDQADIMVGTARADPLVGNAGDDVLTGGAGADAIAGGAGRDVYRYVSRADSNQDTGSGIDNLYDFTTSEDRIDLSLIGATSISVIRTDNGSSFVFAETPSGVFLTTSAGRAINGNDFIYSNGFGVYLVGSSQSEILQGSSLADPISGGAGNDYITGGGGADAMFGDAGFDTFVYAAASDSTQAAADGIFGFVSGEDRIDLRAVRTGASDSYGIAYLSGGSFLFVDLGGNGTNDMVIGLANTTLRASDILWALGSLSEEPTVKEAGPQTLPREDEGLTGVWVSEDGTNGRFAPDLDVATGARFDGRADWFL